MIVEVITLSSNASKQTKSSHPFSAVLEIIPVGTAAVNAVISADETQPQESCDWYVLQAGGQLPGMAGFAGKAQLGSGRFYIFSTCIG
jgi:hypothetical protein